MSDERRGPAADPQGRLRPAARHRGQDVRRRRQASCTTTRATPASTATSSWSTASPGRTLKVGQAQVPLPHPQRLALPRPAAAAEQQRPDDGHRHRRRPHAQAPQHDRPAAGRHGRALRGRHRLRASTPPGTKIQLRNLGVPNSRDFDHTDKVMQFEVTDDAFDPANNAGRRRRQPEPADMEIMCLTRATSTAIKTVKLELHRSNSTWKVNDTTWDDIVESELQDGRREPEARRGPDLGDHQQLGRLVPPHPHPPRRLQDPLRNGRAPFNYELGPKDVAFVGENETRPADHEVHPRRPGRYMIHCHNLPHEDHDMMTQFRVGTDTAGQRPDERRPGGQGRRRPRDSRRGDHDPHPDHRDRDSHRRPRPPRRPPRRPRRAPSRSPRPGTAWARSSAAAAPRRRRPP